MPTFSLAADEAEMLHLWAYVGDEWVEWDAELLVLVDGERRVVSVTDGGKPFVTSGATGAASRHMWVSATEGWQPPIPTNG
jgi:hypothetical protein